MLRVVVAADVVVAVGVVGVGVGWLVGCLLWVECGCLPLIVCCWSLVVGVW